MANPKSQKPFCDHRYFSPAASDTAESTVIQIHADDYLPFSNRNPLDLVERNLTGIPPFRLPTRDCNLDIIERTHGALTFYNLNSRQAEGDYSAQIDSITIHSILFQAFTQGAIQCPLKMASHFLPLDGPGGFAVFVADSKKKR
jgi:hypothetical protein